jgi:hypothetical protein
VPVGPTFYFCTTFLKLVKLLSVKPPDDCNCCPSRIEIKFVKNLSVEESKRETVLRDLKFLTKKPKNASI